MLEHVTLTAAGSVLIATCDQCGGRLSRDTADRPWNLAHLCEAMSDHLAVNHPELRQARTG